MRIKKLPPFFFNVFFSTPLNKQREFLVCRIKKTTPSPRICNLLFEPFLTNKENVQCRLTQSGPPLFKDVTHSCLLVGSLVQNSGTSVSNVPLPSSRINIATYEKAYFTTCEKKVGISHVPFGKSSYKNPYGLRLLPSYQNRHGSSES